MGEFSDYFGLSGAGPRGKLPVMTTEPPISPFKLTPQRTLILVLGILAIVFIIGGIMGGVGNYQALREAVPSSAASSSAG